MNIYKKGESCMPNKKKGSERKYKIKMDGVIVVAPYVFRLKDLNKFENEDIEIFDDEDNEMVKSFIIYNDKGENFVFAFDTAQQCCEHFDYQGLEDVLRFSSKDGCDIVLSQFYDDSKVTLKLHCKKKKSALLTLTLKDLSGYYAHNIFIGHNNKFYHTRIK